MKILRRVFGVISIIIMTLVMSTPVFATTSTKDLPLISINELPLFLDSTNTSGVINLVLDEYSGSSVNLFVLARGDNFATLNIQLVNDDNLIQYGNWTITGNEYNLWTLENLPAGNYTLFVTSTALEPEIQYVEVFARWQ